MAYSKKNTEFKQDAKAARRGNELKNTSDKVFDSKKNADRIYKLLAQLENSPGYHRQNRTLSALEDRLQLLDERLKAGRVNFGKTKDQLGNKDELMQALVAAHIYRQQLKETPTNISDRVSGYFDKQDKGSKKSRQKERTNAVLWGATIGAGAAGIAWGIANYFRPEGAAESIRDAVEKIRDSIEAGSDLGPGKTIVPIPDIDQGKTIVPMPDIDSGVRIADPSYDPTDFEVSVDAPPEGAIAMYADLQEELIKKYPDPALRPPHIQQFIDTPAVKLAIEDNMYRPTDASGNESAQIYKGGKLGFNSAGERVYTDARNGTTILSGDGKFGGEHFDYKTYSGNTAPAQEFSSQAGTGGGGTNSDKLHPGTPWETDKKPWMQGVNEDGVRISDRPMSPSESNADNIFAGASASEGFAEASNGSSSAESLGAGLPEGVERVKISEKLSVDFEIVEDAKGRPQTRFHNVNLDNFNAYHKAYLQQDLSSYARSIASNTSFIEENPGMTAEKVGGDLRKLTNEMIMRDQVLQQGGLDPRGEEYKILEKERDAIRKVIKNNFEWYSEKPLFPRNAFDGVKFPDPNYIPENPAQSASQPGGANGIFQGGAGVETETGQSEMRGVSPEIPTNPGAGTFEIAGNNTEAAKDIKFSVTRNAEGVITELQAISGSIDPSKASLQEFGYNPNWLSGPEFPQAFENTGPGKQLAQDIEKVKGYVALRETLPRGSDEYKYLNDVINKRISSIESKHPSVFN